MALDVGELVARLTIEDDRFIRTLENDERQINGFEQVVRQATTRIDAGFRDTAQSVDRLGTSAQGATRDVSRVGQSATDITRIGTESRQAARQVDGIGEAARSAASDVEDLSGALDDAASGAGDAGGDAGGSFLSGFSDALSSISSKAGPVAGSILGVATLGIGAGIALAAAIKEGMEAELSRDLFQAQTGTTTAQAEKFARAAGEAYADVFGESVEANLSTLKLALQQNIIDPGATQRDAEAVVAQLNTITDALDGDLTMSVNAVSALMSTGLATSAQEASDMIANAVGGSANRGEDLLEVVNEYSAGWKNAGISAEMALALIEQSTDAGAWNADVAGDSLREFGRRVSEEGETIVSSLNDIGLNGEEMFEAFKAGGPEANEAFDLAFDTISKIEDPVARNTAAMSLLGDTSGDFIYTLSSWDPSKALTDFGEFEGAADRLASTMGGNDATSVEGAFRAISVVTDGLKAGLAEAFGPQIAEWANNISNNRAGVIEFFIGVGNAAFDGAEAVLRFVEGGLRGLAEFAGSAAETGASFLDMGANILSVGEAIPVFGDMLGLATGGAADKLRTLADATRAGGEGIDKALTGAANTINDDLIPGLQAGQERFNEFAGNMKLSAAFNDESAKVAAAISGIGVAADGSTMDLSNFNGQIDHANTAQHEMDIAARGLADGFREQVRTGIEAGNTIETLDAQYRGNLDTLRQQLMATGMSNTAANDYIKTLGLTPELVETLIEQPGMPEAHYALDVLNDKVIAVPDEKTIRTEALTDDAKSELEALGLTVTTLPDGKVDVTATTEEGERIIEEWRTRRRILEVKVVPRTEALAAQGLPTDFIGPVNQLGSNADGSIMAGSFADGGQRLPTSATIQAPRMNLIQWAEPETEGEAFIPLALSKRARSLEILAEVARKFGMNLLSEESGKIFQGDPSSLTDETDPTGWRALLGGEYNSKLSKLGIPEDSPFVNGVLGARDLIVNGNYDGRLNALGIAEDHPLVESLLDFNKAKTTERNGNLLQDIAKRFGFGMLKMENGGVLGSLEGIAAGSGLQLTSGYRAGDSGYHGSGMAGDFSNGSGNTPEQLAFANMLADKYKSQIAELIYIDPAFGRCIKDGEFVPDSFYAGAGDHTNHVHAAAKQPLNATADAGTATDVDPNSRQGIANKIIAEGKRRGMGDKEIRSAVAAGLAESDLQNLNYGDRDSQGVFQQRPSQGWGSVEQVTDVDYAIGKYYDTLQGVEGRENMTEAQMAQAVQRSAFSDGSNYQEKIAEADALIAASQTATATATPTTDSSVTSGVTDSGVGISTDGQHVFVTNWPATLGGTDKPADERVPLLTAGLKVFANGGEDHTAQIGTGVSRLWNEPETGGEGYIPLAPAKRPRSVAITKQIANRFGYELVPMANGGLTGFGGYQPDSDRPTLDIPLDGKGQSANKQRANAYNMLALGVGGAFALASGFDGQGKFTGQFNTGSNSPALLEAGVSQITEMLQAQYEQLLEIAKAAANPTPVDVQVDIDQGSRTANVSIMKAGLG